LERALFPPTALRLDFLELVDAAGQAVHERKQKIHVKREPHIVKHCEHRKITMIHDSVWSI
jgi:hypothetical protein